MAVYYQEQYGARRTWVSSLPYLAVMRRRARAQARFIDPRHRGIRTAIDIGCGVGALAAELSGRHVAAVGYDSDAAAIEIGRTVFKADVHQGHVSAAELGRTWDMLCLSHVLEHFASPVPDLRALLALVRPGGFVFVEVPHCTSWMFSKRVPTESHLNFFTPGSLEVLARRLNLTVRRLESCGPEIREYYERSSPDGPPSRLHHFLRRFPRLQAAYARIAPTRTEFDGFFEAYTAAGRKPGIWIRAVFQVPA